MNCRFKINITNQCNLHCDCSKSEKQPDHKFLICLGNITYVNPCFAGCSSFTTYDDSEDTDVIIKICLNLFLLFIL